jgi:hypothetical protein
MGPAPLTTTLPRTPPPVRICLKEHLLDTKPAGFGFLRLQASFMVLHLDNHLATGATPGQNLLGNLLDTKPRHLLDSDSCGSRHCSWVLHLDDHLATNTTSGKALLQGCLHGIQLERSSLVHSQLQLRTRAKKKPVRDRLGTE